MKRQRAEGSTNNRRSRQRYRAQSFSFPPPSLLSPPQRKLSAPKAASKQFASRLLSPQAFASLAGYRYVRYLSEQFAKELYYTRLIKAFALY